MHQARYIAFRECCLGSFVDSPSITPTKHLGSPKGVRTALCTSLREGAARLGTRFTDAAY